MGSKRLCGRALGAGPAGDGGPQASQPRLADQWNKLGSPPQGVPRGGAAVEDAQTGGQVDRWTGGQVDRWTGGQVDRYRRGSIIDRAGAVGGRHGVYGRLCAFVENGTP